MASGANEWQKAKHVEVIASTMVLWRTEEEKEQRSEDDEKKEILGYSVS